MLIFRCITIHTPYKRKIIMTNSTYCKMIFESKSDFEKASFHKGLSLDSSFEYVGSITKNTVSFFIRSNTIPFSLFSTMAKDLNINIVCEFTYMLHHKEPDLIVEIKENGEISNMPEMAKAATEPLVLSDQELLSSPLMIEALEFDNETISPEQQSINSKKDIPFAIDILLSFLLAFLILGPIATIIGLLNTTIEFKNIKDIINSLIITAPSTIFTLIPVSLIFGMIICVNDVVAKGIRPIIQSIFSSKYQKQIDFDIFSRNINELRDIVIKNHNGELKSSLPLVSSWSDFFTDKPDYNSNIKYRLFYLIDNYAMDSFLEISNDLNPELMDELLKPFMISILRDVKTKYDKHIVLETQYQEKKEQELKDKIKRDIEIFENNN